MDVTQERELFPIDSLSEYVYYAQISCYPNGKFTQPSPLPGLSVQQPAARNGG